MDELKPRIHLVHLSSAIGGIEVLLPGIIKRMTAFHFSVFVMRPPLPGRYQVYDGIPVKIKYGSFNNIVCYTKLFIYALNNRRDIFHLYSAGPIALLVIRVARVFGIVYSIHGTRYWDNKLQKVMLKVLWRLAIGRNVLFTCNSEYSGKVYKGDVCKRCNVEVIYNPVDIYRFKPIPERTAAEIPLKVVYCGRLSTGKNLQQWIRVACHLKKRLQALTFEIYGEGPEESFIRKYITDNNADSFIVLKGYTSNPETVYQNADLLLFLSDYESFGNVVIESIICGTPVIAGEIESMIEIFRDYPDFLVRRDDNLAENIYDKLSTYKRLSELTEKARKSFLVRFAPENHDNLMATIYGSFKAKQT